MKRKTLGYTILIFLFVVIMILFAQAIAAQVGYANAYGIVGLGILFMVLLAIGLTLIEDKSGK